MTGKKFKCHTKTHTSCKYIIKTIVSGQVVFPFYPLATKKYAALLGLQFFLIFVARA